MELSPRPSEDRARVPSQRRRVLSVAAIVLLLGAAGVVLVQALGDASVFFKNADEAMAERAELGDRRFRLQGTVVPGSIEPTALGVHFVVVYNDVEVPVQHIGDPVELFQEDVPVVLEGRWGPEAYESDWMAVKHTEVYEAENDERLREADAGGQAAGQLAPQPGDAGADGSRVFAAVVS